jgi:hypothetical protein
MYKKTYAGATTDVEVILPLLQVAASVWRLLIVLGIWANRFCGLRAW